MDVYTVMREVNAIICNDFEDIEIKVNASEVLEEKLKKKEINV